MGLFEENASDFIVKYDKSDKGDIPAEVISLAEERLCARKNKDYKKSDALRDKITEMGYSVKDGKDGYTLEKN